MSLLENFRFVTFPTFEMREMALPTSCYGSVMEIDFKAFLRGRHLITDWDGTWVKHGGVLNSEMRGKLEEAVNSCLTVSVLSNCSAKREAEIIHDVSGLEIAVYRAHPPKPNPEAFNRVFESRKITPEMLKYVVYIGDRFLSDIYCANMAGIGTVVMVQPLGGEPLRIRAVRLLENRLYGKAPAMIV